jgi:hypothetical protein
MVGKEHPIVAQRNILAARCLDLELEIVMRDQQITELKAQVAKLTADADQPTGD